jgi:hypothetical protein
MSSRSRTRTLPSPSAAARLEAISVTSLTDILWTLNHPDLWHLLVGERGWTADEYEDWFAEAVMAQLLGGPLPGASL